MKNRKLTLDPEALTVESFDTVVAGSERRGTVFGNDFGDTNTCRISCPWCTGPYCGSGDPSYPNGCSDLDCSGGCSGPHVCIS